MKTIIVSFSSRTDGNCEKIGSFIKDNIKDSILYSFSKFSIHGCGDCNYECFKNGEMCPYADDMECDILDSIIHSDVTYFILPNYSDYPCANYFVFNERSQFFFQGKSDLLNAYRRVPKRSIVVSNTSEENFIKALSYQTDQNPDILFLSARKYGKSSIQGDLLTSEIVVSEIVEFIGK